MEVVLRQACKEDLPAIVALLADDGLGNGREDARMPLDEAYVSAFEALDGDPNQFLVVAQEGEVIAATMQLTFIAGVSRKGAWRCQIEAVRVAASHRGSGLGQRMFEFAIQESRSRGCSLVQLTTDKTREDAHRFYDRLGFVASHIGYKLKL
ncbi:GNAT family N-acetyltransferase [Anderseniella sp. Alg231-50]|uniref:GNAT family N-acetyltransferase n=1 Tax=Anderseniella sp. Alg231-50 TaxID=1922226 RepID=UPI000D55B7FC